MHLRGLIIDGAGTGQTGISYNSGSALIVENCVIGNLVGDGIDGAPLGGSLSVSDTVVTGNSGSGIVVGYGSPLGTPDGNGVITALFNRVKTDYNGNYGIALQPYPEGTTVLATVIGSSAASNGQAGFYCLGNTTVMMFHSISANNRVGVFEEGVGPTYIGQSVVSGNSNPIASGFESTPSGIEAGIYSYGTNQIDTNAESVETLVSAAQK